MNYIHMLLFWLAVIALYIFCKILKGYYINYIEKKNKKENTNQVRLSKNTDGIFSKENSYTLTDDQITWIERWLDDDEFPAPYYTDDLIQIHKTGCYNDQQRKVLMKIRKWYIDTK